MKKVLAILQARVSSTRLPGKVLKNILGEPMLARQIERLRRTKTIDTLIVATSIKPEDDPLEALAGDLGVPCFRGSLEDVLDRFYQCALPYAPQHVVRLTGDCPLADPDVIDRVVRYHIDGDYDYTSNVMRPTWPHGMDVEVMRFACLSEAHRETSLPHHREHVTPFLYQHPERYRLGSVTQKTDQSGIRVTVDEPEDFEVVSRIYEGLYANNPEFTVADVVMFLKQNPNLKSLNDQFKRSAIAQTE